MSEVNKIDVDALETQEWLQALESVVREEGVDRKSTRLNSSHAR